MVVPQGSQPRWPHAGSVVVIASRTATRCEAAASRLSDEIGRIVRGHEWDVTDEERAVTDLVDRVLRDHGRLDVLVVAVGYDISTRTGKGARPEAADRVAWG
jgi:NAD(P)-dependent dehydrogenase (short-subunit alcohol dehydrogenase family)